tara:strand:+ start:4211 stop:5326 length:1116 start_codon:yes stop_codon:yes gene_type:complete
MSLSKIKVKNKEANYSIIIGNKAILALPSEIKRLCPKTKKIGIVIDKKVPKQFKSKLKKLLKKYELYLFEFNSSEKLKSFTNANKLAEICLAKKFSRSDLLIALGGGVIGDFTAFVASILKRGINFINIPSTLLAQVDSSIGGKTGVNSKHGKNLLGTFFQPKLVISDIALINSLNKRQMICGYAEILKHSIIKKSNFFNWLRANTKVILEKKNFNILKKAVYESCKIKLYFVNKDLNEKNIRMTLNYGHTFAHAIEANSKFSNKVNHGEAVLIGMMMATKLSVIKKTTSIKTLNLLKDIYLRNNLNHDLKKILKKNENNKIINFMKNDKKNNDNKINLILLKKIGVTSKPGSYKISINEIKKIFPRLTKI